MEGFISFLVNSKWLHSLLPSIWNKTFYGRKIQAFLEFKRKEEKLNNTLHFLFEVSVEKIANEHPNYDATYDSAKFKFNVYKSELYYYLTTDEKYATKEDINKDILNEFLLQVSLDADTKGVLVVKLGSGILAKLNKISQKQYDNITPIMPFLKFKSIIEGQLLIDFESDDNIESILSILRDNDKKYVYIQALSGMGKTRWIWEAYKNEKNFNSIYYCEDTLSESFNDGFNNFLNRYHDSECVLILDNCSAKKYNEVKRKIGNNANIRLIGLSNDLSEVMYTDPDITIRKFDYHELKDITLSIINKRLPREINEENKRIIIEYAEDIPYMAVLIVKAIEKDLNPDYKGIFTNSTLLERILNLQGKDAEEQKIVLETISLFQPLGYLEEQKPFYDFVVNSKNLTNFRGAIVEKDDLFKKVIKIFKDRQIIEQQSNWINVRPRVLAVSLVSEWLDNCDEERVDAIASEIKALDFSGFVIETICRRLEYLKGSPSAENLISKLVGEGGLFSSEKVVCSDLGSRLFLALATVNPVAVSECLYRILYYKDVKWLRENIVDDIRRNIVWTLEKLCFPKESFNKSMWVLSKLALSENENISNNATGVFEQVFCIVLPGTEVSLKDRYLFLKEVHDKGSCYDEIVLKSIEYAFQYLSGGRAGGLENFGYVKLSDYNPTYGEIYEYWNDFKELMLNWMDENDDVVDSIASFVERHVIDLCRLGDSIYIASDLIHKIIEKRGNTWNEMLEHLNSVKHYNFKHFNDKYKDIINTLIEELTQNDFVSRLMYAENNYRYAAAGMSFDEKRNEFDKSYYQPYAIEFIENEYYDDTDIVNKLIELNHEVPSIFAVLIGSGMGEEAVNKMLRIGIDFINGKEKNYESMFLLYFCANIPRKYNIEWFYDELRDNGYYPLYIRMKLTWDDNDLGLFKELISIFKGKETKYIQYYMGGKYCKTSKDVYDICQLVETNFPKNEYNLLMPLLLHAQYKDVFGDEKVLIKVQDILIKYLRNEEEYGYDVLNLVGKVLDDYEVRDFAIDINKVIIERSKLSNLPFNADYRNLFYKLLPKYKDDIWNDLSKAMADKDNRYWMNTYNYLSAMDEGEGSLFVDNEDKVKQLCLDYAQTDVPVRIAHMVPKYHLDEHENVDRFSDFILWMLENIKKFKDPDRVLSGIDCRVSSFFSVGSVIPVYDRQYRCYQLVVESEKYDQLVVEWAKTRMKMINKERKQEQNYEDYKSIIR